MSPGNAPALQPDTAPSHWHPPSKSAVMTAGVLLVALAALLAILAMWGLPPFRSSLERTDNAYVRAHSTVISPQVSGYVVTVPVNDFDQVKAGQLLARVDDRIYRARVEQAQANLAAARANLDNNAQAHASRSAGIRNQAAALESALAQLQRTRADMARADDLASDGSISIREKDQTTAALRQAQAQVLQAQAARAIAEQDLRAVTVARRGLEAQVQAAQGQLDAASVDLENTVIVAPADGQLGEIGVRLGQYVTNGVQLMTLVPDERWVIADYKENQTAHMRVGQSATFSVDALDGATFTGHITQLSPAAGSEFAVLKPDNATGNFVKVPQRIGVRIALDPGQTAASGLRPGMSVEVAVNTAIRP